MNTIVLEPDGRGSFTFTFSSPRGEMSGRVNVGTEGPPDRRSTADKKELVGLIDGVRESAQSWKELLLDLKRRGLSMPPELAVADGALGFLAGDRGSVAEDARPALLGPQDCQRP